MGRGLYFKVFTWFWFTVILAALTLEATADYVRQRARFQEVTPTGLLPVAGKAAVGELERFGEPALADYIFHLQRTQSVMAYFFDAGGNELTRRGTLPAIRDAGLFALRAPGLHRAGDDDEIAAAQVSGSKGALYAMVFVLQRKAMTRNWLLSPYGRLAGIIVMSGVFCFLIARHLTRPLLRLQVAAAGIAEGRLATRVSTDLQQRGDEIAGLAKDFNRMASRIEALVHGQEQLLANVSHELRSPLARLMVALTLVKQGPSEEVPEHLERIGTEARRLDKLIGQLLTLSRIDSAVDGGRTTNVDLTTLLHQVAGDAEFEARASARRVVVTADLDCILKGDEEALRGAFENVVRNAVRYAAEATDVEISLRCELTRAIVRVRDHGPGVPENMLRSIFVPFRRAESSTDGCGLGLAIAERAIVAHSGKIRAFNAESQGLVVEIELPIDTAHVQNRD